MSKRNFSFLPVDLSRNKQITAVKLWYYLCFTRCVVSGAKDLTLDGEISQSVHGQIWSTWTTSGANRFTILYVPQIQQYVNWFEPHQQWRWLSPSPNYEKHVQNCIHNLMNRTAEISHCFLGRLFLARSALAKVVPSLGRSGRLLIYLRRTAAPSANLTAIRYFVLNIGSSSRFRNQMCLHDYKIPLCALSLLIFLTMSTSTQINLNLL